MKFIIFSFIEPTTLNERKDSETHAGTAGPNRGLVLKASKENGPRNRAKQWFEFFGQLLTYIVTMNSTKLITTMVGTSHEDDLRVGGPNNPRSGTDGGAATASGRGRVAPSATVECTLMSILPPPSLPVIRITNPEKRKRLSTQTDNETKSKPQLMAMTWNQNHTE